MCRRHTRLAPSQQHRQLHSVQTGRIRNPVCAAEKKQELEAREPGVEREDGHQLRAITSAIIPSGTPGILRHVVSRGHTSKTKLSPRPRVSMIKPFDSTPHVITS